MLEVAPFQGIRFTPTAGNDISTRLAPPYDVLDAADKERLLTRDARNIVAIDLPHVPPKDLGPPEVYERSRKLMNDWLNDGTLARDAKPSLYLYHQKFQHAGKSYVRKMFIARLRLREFSEGVILPHEQTFGGPKEDRLALMKATQCNLSPIFGLYRDPQDAVGREFATLASQHPTAQGTLDGVENLLWIASDAGLIQKVASSMSDKKVYIADGHHRYGTALMYREHVKANLASKWTDQHAANYVMFVLASMDDPGCLILPYHRVLLHIDLATLVNAWGPGTAASDAASADIRLVEGATGKEQFLRFTDRAKLAMLEPKEVTPWRELDAAYLHRYLLKELLTSKTNSEPKIAYVKSEQDALTTARSEKGVALLLNATPMAHLRAVSDAGGLMPQKSTYFHPKLATGMTINSLES